jgi:hypothetical protein
MLAPTTEVCYTKAKCVLLTSAIVNSNNTSNNKGRGGYVGSRKDGPKDWHYGKEDDNREVKGKIWWWCLQYNNGKRR